MSTLRKHAVALGVAGAFLLGSVAPPLAAPVASSTAAVKTAMPSDTIDVRHRRWRGSPALPFALGVFGTMAAFAAADAYWNGYYYGHPYPYAYAYPYRYPYAHPYVQGPFLPN
jgi:hypothetical protein